MCYRATQTSKTNEYADYYSAPVLNDQDLEDQIYYHANGFAHPNLVAISAKDGARQTERMQWGLMPNWKKPLPDMVKLSNNTLNAKSETIFDLASFKGSISILKHIHFLIWRVSMLFIRIPIIRNGQNRLALLLLPPMN
jgi:putative SOS response-associated peptidase YedK